MAPEVLAGLKPGDLMFLYRYNKQVTAEEMGTFVETGKRTLALLLQAQPAIA